jgi:two-component sensor histidine kinase
MIYLRKIGCYLLILLCACTNAKQKEITHKQYENLVDSLIYLGDSIYAKKNSADNFKQSLMYYDSAYSIAIKLNDTNMLCSAVIAKGTVYDAWGNEPKTTFYYYNLASELLNKLNQPEEKAYARALAAHALAASKDSAKTAEYIINTDEILAKNKGYIQQVSYALLAYECSQIKNFTLLQKQVDAIINIDSIKNSGVDFKNKLIIALARRDLFLKQPNSKWITELQNLLSTVNNVSDSLTYSNILYQFYKQQANYSKAIYYNEIQENLRTKLFNDDLNKGLNAQLAISKEKEKVLQATLHTSSNKIIILTYLLIGLTIFGLILGILGLIRSRKKILNYNRNLSELNVSLEHKVEEVEMLNKEMSHRVKNNLFLLHSIVQLQLSKSNDDKVSETLRSIANRIEAVSAIHQNVHAGEEQIDLEKYVNTIVTGIVNTYNVSRNIVTHLSMDKVRIDNKTAVPIGLILNEWMVNSIKNADVKNNSLSLNLKITDNHNTINISYADNGMPVDEKSIQPGLGLKIIELLARQLKGKLSNNKFNYNLTIPYAASV